MPQVSGWQQVRFGELGFAPIFFCVAALYRVAIMVEGLFCCDGQSRPLKARW
jgi:hypothetical protein